MTTFGASQAFDLLGRIMFAPADAVLLEDDVYSELREGPADRRSVAPSLVRFLGTALRAAA